jgi:hypothetical protein
MTKTLLKLKFGFISVKNAINHYPNISDILEIIAILHTISRIKTLNSRVYSLNQHNK